MCPTSDPKHWPHWCTSNVWSVLFLKMRSKQILFLKRSFLKEIPKVRFSTFHISFQLLTQHVAKPEKKKKAARGKIDKTMISSPQSGSFVHVAGYDKNGFISTGVGPSRTRLMENLEHLA